MKADQQLIDDLAGAILDGAPIDWASVESSVEETDQLLIRELKLLAALSEVHRGTPPIASTRCATSSSSSERKNDGAAEQWAHLRLLERIGRGAFGEVYRAWDTRLDREVALKLLPADRASGDRVASSIIHEGRLLARVHHPNVVTIHGAEQIGDQIGLWMEFVRGHTLEQILQQQKQLSIAEAADIGLELCRAVSAVHSAGLLHRDIKAHNVMRAEDGRIVLMDFGTGREVDDEDSSDLAGTPLYLAPEVLHGQPATVRSDLYSLGVLLYRLVTGTYPVYARTLRGVRQAHERGERTDVQVARPNVPSKLARIIERAIDPEPERRYETADALGADLAALKHRPRLVRLAYAAGVAAVLILAAAVWEVRGRHVGSSRLSSTLVARLAGWNPVTARNVSPVEQPVIAVLPFSNLSAEPDSDYFVDGLTDEIIRNLALIRGLQVRSRTSSFAFKGKPRNLRDVGEQLGANLIVEGSVFRSGIKLRIIAQLVQVAGEVPLWAERFDRDAKSSSDVFAILDEISRAIVNKLRLALGTGQRRYDIDLDTYELYLKARALADRRGASDPKQAVELFEQIIARDPAFAPAYAGLANAYAWMSIPESVPFETAYSAMRPAAAKALQLDPLLAEAHAAMGVVYAYQRAWEDSETSFRKAIDLNPSLTQVYTNYSFHTLRPVGRFDEAEQLMRVAVRNDPLSLDAWEEIAELEFTAGRYEDAIHTLQRVHAVDPEFPFVNMYLARALMFAGKLTEAWSVIEGMKQRGRPLPPHYLAHAYVMSGRREEAQKLAAFIAERAVPYSDTIFYAALGDMDRAFEALERTALHAPQRVPLLLTWPETAALRKDSRLVAFRRRFGLP